MKVLDKKPYVGLAQTLGKNYPELSPEDITLYWGTHPYPFTISLPTDFYEVLELYLIDIGEITYDSLLHFDDTPLVEELVKGKKIGRGHSYNEWAMSYGILNENAGDLLYIARAEYYEDYLSALGSTAFAIDISKLAYRVYCEMLVAYVYGYLFGELDS